MADAQPIGDQDKKEIEVVARCAVVVTPKEAYSDWLVSLGEDGRRELQDQQERDQWPMVFLIPAFVDEDDARQFFTEHVGDAFEWVLPSPIERRLWPKKRDFEKFCEWFEISHGDTVIDQGHGKFYLESDEDRIGDDYHKWIQDLLKLGPPPTPVVKYTLLGDRYSPEAQKRLDSIVRLTRCFSWCNALFHARVKAGVSALHFELTEETELVDDLHEHHKGTTLHWLSALASVIDGWEALHLVDVEVAKCLEAGGDVTVKGSIRYRLERARKAAFRFEDDPALIEDARDCCQGEVVRWAAHLDSVFLQYFRRVLIKGGPAMNWVFR
jgi:hypothetical protein